jgi:hypothetical protein
MKKLLSLAVLGVLLGAASGCRVAECWNYAWNSRFHPERNAQPMVVDQCDPCCDPCSDPCSGGAVVVPAMPCR